MGPRQRRPRATNLHHSSVAHNGVSRFAQQASTASRLTSPPLDYRPTLPPLLPAHIKPQATHVLQSHRQPPSPSRPRIPCRFTHPEVTRITRRWRWRYPGWPVPLPRTWGWVRRRTYRCATPASVRVFNHRHVQPYPRHSPRARRVEQRRSQGLHKYLEEGRDPCLGEVEEGQGHEHGEEDADAQRAGPTPGIPDVADDVGHERGAEVEAEHDDAHATLRGDGEAVHQVIAVRHGGPVEEAVRRHGHPQRARARCHTTRKSNTHPTHMSDARAVAEI